MSVLQETSRITRDATMYLRNQFPGHSGRIIHSLRHDVHELEQVVTWYKLAFQQIKEF